jgi:hypothetical protein
MSGQGKTARIATGVMTGGLSEVYRGVTKMNQSPDVAPSAPAETHVARTERLTAYEEGKKRMAQQNYRLLGNQSSTAAGNSLLKG